MANPVTTGYDWLKATELEKEAYANQYYTGLFSGSKWATNTLTWSAPTVDFGGIFYTPPGQTPKFTAFSTQDIQQVTTFLDYLSSIVNLHFSYSNSASSNIKIGYENMTQGGYANYPPDGRIYISDQYIGTISTPGSYGYSALMHEFGHSLGLKHPFDPSATIPIALETRASTVMSYSAFGLYSPGGFDYAQSYMPIDIQALISLYGKAVGITNTDFTFNFSKEASFSYTTQNATVNMFSPFYLYDANHKVTLNFSTLNDNTEHLTIDLKNYGISYAPTSGLQYAQYNYSTQMWSDAQTASATNRVYNVSISSNTDINAVIGSPLGDAISVGGCGIDCSIDGGGGMDTVTFSGSSLQYKITRIGNSISVEDTIANRDGVDNLTNVEVLQFADKAINLVTTSLTIQNDYLGIVRSPLSPTQAAAIADGINAGTQTEFAFVTGLLAQVANTSIPAVSVEASMYGTVGTSAEVTLLAAQFLPPQVANAIKFGFNPQVYATEALGLTFAFGNEIGSTAFANAFGPAHIGMPNSSAGDAAFAAAASTAIFGTASTATLVSALQGYVANWKMFFTINGLPSTPHPTSDQIDLAARGAAWGDAVGLALANHLGPLYGQASNFLQNAAQGTAVYSASFASQPPHSPFQGEPGAIDVMSSVLTLPLVGVSLTEADFLSAA